MKRRLALAALTVALGGGAGYQFIGHHEGTRLSSYQDQAGVWTICVGHTRTAKPNQVVSKAVCDRLLQEDVRVAEAAVHKHLRPDLQITWEQYLALVSFVFNLGETNFKNSTLRKEVLAGNCYAVGAQFLRWNKIRINGVLTESRGLNRRRGEERDLWVSGCD